MNSLYFCDGDLKVQFISGQTRARCERTVRRLARGETLNLIVERKGPRHAVPVIDIAHVIASAQ